MTEIKRKETMWAEMEPDVYGGKTCDQIVPRWKAFCEGDQDGDHQKVLKLDAIHFPPGTEIVIQEPLCPSCGERREPRFFDKKATPTFTGPCACGFDWDTWVRDTFS